MSYWFYSFLFLLFLCGCALRLPIGWNCMFFHVCIKNSRFRIMYTIICSSRIWTKCPQLKLVEQHEKKKKTFFFSRYAGLGSRSLGYSFFFHHFRFIINKRWEPLWWQQLVNPSKPKYRKAVVIVQLCFRGFGHSRLNQRTVSFDSHWDYIYTYIYIYISVESGRLCVISNTTWWQCCIDRHTPTSQYIMYV